MNAFDPTCPDSFAEAFNSLPDSSEKPQAYRLPDGEQVDVAYIRRDGHAVLVDGRWVEPGVVNQMEKLP
ncbi:hypothetical protein ACTXGQ_04395 [Marinobacter sp. 1Y8]